MLILIFKIISLFFAITYGTVVIGKIVSKEGVNSTRIWIFSASSTGFITLQYLI